MKKEGLLYGLAAIGVGYLAFELSHYSFNSGIRRKVSERDKNICQVIGCSSHEITIHHLIPESCLRPNVVKGSGVYVDFLREVFGDLNADLNGNTQSMMNKWFDFIQHSSSNAIALCIDHHSGLHQDAFSDTDLILKPNPRHPDRPYSLSATDVGGFLVSTYNQLLLLDQANYSKDK